MRGTRKPPFIGITADVRELNKKQAYVVYRSYADAVEKENGLPVFIPYTGRVKDLVDRIDGLVITGGDFDIPPAMYGEEPVMDLRTVPERTAFESAVYTESLKKGIPVLGVCGGCQLINVLAGGSLYQDIKKQVSKSLDHGKGEHRVCVSHGTILHNILVQNKTMTNSSHHQAVKEPGRGVIVSARSDDGIVEAIELKDYRNVLGMQWHPERMGQDMLLIYRWLVTKARR